MALIDFSSSTQLAGSVRGPRSEPVVGARVELVEPQFGRVLDHAVSVADGEYRMRLLPELDVEAFQVQDLLLRAVDARSRPLAEVRGVVVRPATTLVFDIEVPAERLPGFEPVGNPIVGVPEPLLDAGALRTIDAAISALVAVDESRRAEYRRAVSRALPELATFRTVGEDAFGLLGGNPDAARRFEVTLARYSGTPTTSVDKVFGWARIWYPAASMRYRSRIRETAGYRC